LHRASDHIPGCSCVRCTNKAPTVVVVLVVAGSSATTTYKKVITIADEMKERGKFQAADAIENSWWEQMQMNHREVASLLTLEKTSSIFF
jgi:hypothetical protein